MMLRICSLLFYGSLKNNVYLYRPAMMIDIHGWKNISPPNWYPSMWHMLIYYKMVLSIGSIELKMQFTLLSPMNISVHVVKLFFYTKLNVRKCTCNRYCPIRDALAENDLAKIQPVYAPIMHQSMCLPPPQCSHTPP